MCRGKFKSITIVGFTKQKKCCKSPTMDKNCCKDFKYSLKKSNSQENNTSSIIIPTPSIQAIPITFFEFNFVEVKQKVFTSNKSFHDPPPPQVFPKIYIKNCVYLI